MQVSKHAFSHCSLFSFPNWSSRQSHYFELAYRREMSASNQRLILIEDCSSSSLSDCCRWRLICDLQATGTHRETTQPRIKNCFVFVTPRTNTFSGASQTVTMTLSESVYTLTNGMTRGMESTSNWSVMEKRRMRNLKDFRGYWRQLAKVYLVEISDRFMISYLISKGRRSQRKSVHSVFGRYSEEPCVLRWNTLLIRRNIFWRSSPFEIEEEQETRKIRTYGNIIG